MPSWKKCVFGCVGNCPVFSLPKNESVRQKWLDFIFGDDPPKKCYICARHFTDDCFLNKSFYETGLISKLSLKYNAVPTLRSAPPSPPPATSSTLPHFIHRPYTRSVSTQLSAGTLRTQHYRSRGFQASVGTVSRGTCTEQSFPQFSCSAGARPPKRPRLDPEEEEDDDLSVSESQDGTYEPGVTFTEVSDLTEMESPSEFEDVKYIVFESALRELFENCPVCERHCVVHQRRCGTFVAFSQDCPHCSFTRRWQSQPLKGHIPQGNLELSAAVYFTGASFPNIQKICNTMNLKVHQYDTFRSHARNLLEPAILHKWKVDQGKVLEEMKSKGKIGVSGDMRADSPGHSASFGSYTIMENEDKKILDIQLVQSNEADSRVNMEKEGLRRGLDLLQSRSVQLDHIVTDRHPQVQDCLQERDMSHYYSLWPVVKGLCKKLDALAKRKGCEVIQTWLPDIRNHMHRAVCSSTSGSEKEAKWTSLVNHIQNVHEHDGSVALRKVKKLLLNKRILKDVHKLSSNHQTPALESFHTLVLHFAPKNVNIPFIGRLCRLYLAAMHHNENATRELLMANGKPKCRVQFPKSTKGRVTATSIKTDATFGYRRDLMQLVFDEVLSDPERFQTELQKTPVPPPLSSDSDRPEEEVVPAQKSRFHPAVAQGQQISQYSSHQGLGTAAETTEHTTG